MANKKILTQQKESSKMNHSCFDIDYSKVVVSDSLDYLCDEHNFMEAIEECLIMKDIDALVEITEIHLSALQQKKLLEEGMPADESVQRPRIDRSALCKSIERAMSLHGLTNLAEAIREVCIAAQK